ncbi:MAG TPA: alkaline phosphatase family protein [Gaiellaceae bacterium]|nr:alkaline phosphatase family protein [Gaiellaceae bacterium]
MRTVAIGLDGCSWNVLEPLLATGELPNLSALCAEGAFGVLESTIPFYTGPAWASFATGASPAAHGIYDFMMLRPEGRLSVARQSDLRRLTYYQQLGREGRRSVLVNLPIDQDGCDGAVIVNSWLTDGDARRILPADKRERYASALAAYINYPTTFNAPLADHAAELCTIEERRIALALELMAGEEWDHFFVLLSSTDWLAHAAAGLFLEGDPEARKAYLDLYKVIDAGIGRLREEAPDALLVVLSDHGQCHERYALQVNGVLRGLGFVTLRGEGLKGRALRVPPWLRRTGLDRALRPAAAALRGALRRRLDIELVTPRRAVEVDRIRSKAFSPTVASYAVHGELDAAEQSEVKRALLAVRLPDGTAAVDGAWTFEELYGRPRTPGAPTILFAPTTGVRPSTDTEGPVVREVSRPGRGAHQRDGIIVIAGEGVHGGSIGRVSLYDVAPTLARAMGSAPLEGGDGRVLFEAFTDGALAEEPLEWASAEADETVLHDGTADAAVEGRLKALGYI